MDPRVHARDAGLRLLNRLTLGAWLVEHRLAARLVHRDGTVQRLAGWPDPAKSKLTPTKF